VEEVGEKGPPSAVVRRPSVLAKVLSHLQDLTAAIGSSELSSCVVTGTPGSVVEPPDRGTPRMTTPKPGIVMGA
jgi:hypothetical protein